MPAWIHPIRLTTIADAHDRLNKICCHLRTCIDAYPEGNVKVSEHAGIVASNHERHEVDNCCGHAELIVAALEWAKENVGADAMVIECHAAQSSGGADPVLLKEETVHLFEASTSDARKKHKKDLQTLDNEAKALVSGKIIKTVKKYRVGPTSAKIICIAAPILRQDMAEEKQNCPESFDFARSPPRSD